MITISILLIILSAGVESLTCPNGQQLCGSTLCYDPNIQGCTNSNTTIQCINSCNGTCYSNSQYCYNNTKVCNNGESVCNVQQGYTYFSSFPIGLTCYNSSQHTCSNNTFCTKQYSCGTKCLTDYNTVCANNRTICSGFNYWSIYPYTNAYVSTCGSQETCYDNTTSVCLNGTTVCQGLNARLCGTNCFNPDTQTCTNGTVRCINSCNGTCYSNSQYCYNNTKVCNNVESVCNVQQGYTYFSSFPNVLTCYNSSQFVCSNNTLCYRQYSCGTQCLTNYNSICVNNQTICSGFYYWSYYPYSNAHVKTCGSQRTCYDNTTSSCVNGTTVCQGLNARLCGTNCFNPDTQTCTGGIVRCINTCNGTCYSNSQYCYNNTKICNNGELVCNIQGYNYYSSFPNVLTCYNSSQYMCANNTLCPPQYSCGTQCITGYYTVCANNKTVCSGFNYWLYYPFSNAYVSTCGPQQTCYDNTTNVCLGMNGTLCPFGNQLCSGICYNPQSQYCIGGNNSIYCLSNPSSPNCPSTSTNATSVSAGCCKVQNCSKNSDCCDASASECQCYRRNQTDVYGSCANPNITPICGNSCPVQGRCKEDSDCCKCQCAEIKFTDSDGQLITRKQCISR